jgi:hypothetical protein
MPNQITLLEGVPFERELASLRSRYETTKFENLFRTTKINIYQQQQYQQPLQMRPSPVSQPQSMPQLLPTQMHPPGLQPMPAAQQQNGMSSSLPNPSSQPQPSIYQSPYQTTIHPAAMQRTPSASTNNSAMNPMATSWATKVLSTPPTQVASPPPTPQPSQPTTIPRNKYGQRIDPLISYDKSEVKRVQKIHMCNVHFLRQDCPYGDECSHDHFYKPNKNELLTLKFVARQTPCHFGTACDDIKCIYGHK